jgi:formate hydrogenlyase transcriptional activator
VLEHYGWTPEQVQVSEFDVLVRDIAHSDDVESFLAACARGFAGTSEWEVAARSRRRDGVYRWFLVRGTPLRDGEGCITRWYLTGTDVDDQKKAADKVREQERELREIPDLVPHHILVAAPDGTVLHGNRIMLDYYGLTTDDVQDAVAPRLARQLMHRDDITSFMAVWERGFAGSVPWEAEARFRGRGGEYRWFLVRATPLFEERGRIVRWYITGTDIGDRKTAEDKVRQDEQQLRMLVDFVPELLVELSPQAGVQYANRAVLDYTGLTLVDIVDRYDLWPVVVHADDMPTMLEEIRGVADGTIGADFEVRLRRRDGQYRWHLCRRTPFPDEDGRIIRWFASATDIHERKLAEQRAHAESHALREELDKVSMFEEIVGTSPRLRGVLANVSRVAPTESTVLVTGETGTGKELVARAIHKRSNRSSRAFVSVNCAAIPPALIASELFGHEKGAFTGALTRRIGRFELADGGTIFLDEVGDLPLDTQLALLRVLQEREFERLGSTRPIKVDVRVIAATNRDLKAAMASGGFRTDLFYRLSVFPIEIPPLRHRRPDIPLLVAYFADRYASKAGKTIRQLDKRMLDLVTSYPWPGNVRELQNVIERAVIVCETDTLVVDENWLSQETHAPARPLDVALVAQERGMIEAALTETQGKVAGPAGAAAKLGLPASTLESRIRSLGIRKLQYKRP